LLRHARQELEACIPGIDLRGVAWSSYRVDRAEPATGEGSRPQDIGLIVEENILTAWPTKLVLAPHLADTIVARLDLSSPCGDPGLIRSMGTAAPQLAELPWEREARWKEGI